MVGVVGRIGAVLWIGAILGEGSIGGVASVSPRCVIGTVGVVVHRSVLLCP